MMLTVLSAASMVLGNLAALAQISVRRLLAYSAIAHAGYMLLGARLSSRIADCSTNAILYYILTYGLTTIGAFGVVSVVERATGSDRLDAFLGLHKRNPLLAAVLLVLFLSLAGIPPLVGFWAKFNLFAAVLSVSAGPVPFALVALAIAMSAVSLYYYLQVLKRAYVMPASRRIAHQGASRHHDCPAGNRRRRRRLRLLPGTAPKLDHKLLSVVAPSRVSRSAVVRASSPALARQLFLHHPPNSWQPHQWIGRQPGCGTRQQSHDTELYQRRRRPAMLQQADPHQHWRVNDVHRIRSPVEPRPKSRWLIHPLAEYQQPQRYQAPGNERLPESIENRRPRQPA